MRIVRSKNVYEKAGDKLKNAVHCHNGIFNEAKDLSKQGKEQHNIEINKQAQMKIIAIECG